MAPGLLKIVVYNILICQVFSSYVYQYPQNQYYQQTYPPPSPIHPKPQLPKPEAYPNYQPYQPARATFVYPNPEPKPTPQPPVLPVLPILPEVPIPQTILKEEKRKPGFDPNVLNNLAIALQLLIVNNILSNPPDFTESCKLADPFNKPGAYKLSDVYSKLPETYAKEYPEKTPFQAFFEANAMELQRSLPNSKFLGEADNIMNNYGSFSKPVPARTCGLMSPYEAITSNSMDGSQFSKKDFQSPYSAMIAFDNAKELFSMADLF